MKIFVLAINLTNLHAIALLVIYGKHLRGPSRYVALFFSIGDPVRIQHSISLGEYVYSYPRLRLCLQSANSPNLVLFLQLALHCCRLQVSHLNFQRPR